MTLALLLSVAMGAALGLLGGGGSILTVPILLYAVGLGAQESIATSLLVVGLTSLAAMIPHARAGHVLWRVGIPFSAVSMFASYAAGFLAHYVPAGALLVAFAGVMVVTAIAMLRRCKRGEEPSTSTGPRRTRRVVRDGLAVGLLSGLVGAGGGFLIVPALSLWGGLHMRDAVGTSLLVIALNSLAGFAGHAPHVAIDFGLAGALTGVAAAGGVFGAVGACRVNPTLLRKGFAWLVLAMAAFIFYEQVPEAVRRAVFVDRWPFWAGGLAIGAFVLLLLRRTNRLLGVSTGYLDACRAITDADARRSRLRPNRSDPETP